MGGSANFGIFQGWDGILLKVSESLWVRILDEEPGVLGLRWMGYHFLCYIINKRYHFALNP